MKYKSIIAPYITCIGEKNNLADGEMEITDAEYNEILSVIHNKPKATDTTDYRLRDDLTWEAYEVEPPDPDPEVDDAELLNILMGGAE